MVGTTPNYSLLMATGVAVMVAGLVGAAALTGALPALAAKQQAAASAAKVCANCGIIASVKKRAFYDVTVQMDDGRIVVISQGELPGLVIGDRVRLNGDLLVKG